MRDWYNNIRRAAISVFIGLVAVCLCLQLNIDSAKASSILPGGEPLYFTFRMDDALFHILLTAIITVAIIVVIRIRNQKRAKRASEIDKLTGIPNMQTFCKTVQKLQADNPDKNYAIIRIDIDHFKLFNDTYGSEEGDKLLAKFANVIKESADNYQRGVCVGYISADHFAICMQKEDIKPQRIYEYALDLLKKQWEDYNFNISIGLCEIDRNSSDILKFCDNALLALKSVKDDYDKSWAWYNDSMKSTLLEEREVTGVMREALESGQFVPYFQPQYNYATGEMSGTEVLVRWIHPQDGLIPPYKFIPVFEKNGFIYELDKYIWKKSCEYIKKWKDNNYNVPPISINISRRDILHTDLVDTIKNIVSETGLTPKDLYVEITESLYVENPELLSNTMKDLHEAGFFIEMDDFGSGYSSLTILKEMQFDLIKLDMNFLRGGGDTGKGGNILTSVVHLAHQIDLPVIAEGVEEKRQADFLKSIGCYYMQGYFFAKPMPVEDYEELIKSNDGNKKKDSRFEDIVDNSVDFLDYSTQSALLFNSFVGGACILEYRGEHSNILRINDKLYSELGIEDNNLNILNSNFEDYLTEDTQGIFTDMLKNGVAYGGEVECEVCSLKLSEGEEIWIHMRARCLANKIDSYIFYCDIENVTERKILNMRNISLIEDLNTIVNNLPGGIARFRFTQDLLLCEFVSEGFCKIRGYEPNELAAIYYDDALGDIHPEDMDVVRNAVIKVRKTKRRTNVSYRIRTKDERYVWIDTSMAYFEDKSGEFLYVYANDISESIELSSELQNRKFELSNILNSIPGGTAVYEIVDGKYNLLDMSHGAAAIVGYTPQEIREGFAENRFFSICEADIPKVIQSIHELDKTDSDLDFRMYHKDGSIVWVNRHDHIVVQDDGRVMIYSAFRNVSSAYYEVEALDFIKSLIEQYENADNVEAGIYRVLEALGIYTEAARANVYRINKDKCVNLTEWVNNGKKAQAEELLEIDSKNIINYYNSLSAGEVLVVNDLENIKEIMPGGYEKLKRLGINSVVSFPLIHRGKLVAFINIDEPNVVKSQILEKSLYMLGRVMADSIVNADENIVDNDKAELKYSDKNLELAIKELRESYASKTEFISRMTHDIRTPMNAIIGLTEILKQNTSDEEYVKDCINKIGVSSSHMLSLVNDILDFSKLESGKRALNIKPIDLRATVNDCLSIIRGNLVNRDLRFKVIRENLKTPYALGDALAIRQVLVNILSNSIKYTPDGGTIVFEATNTSLDESHIEVSYTIRDNGIGMTPEFKEKLFEAFSQENAIDNGYKGSGLGLVICKYLVELMNGQIIVDSEKDKGTTFTVKLVFEIIDNYENDKQTEEEVNLSVLRNARVLLVEDNEINSEISKQMLENNGMYVVAAVDGADALKKFEAAAEGTFDIVLMDIQMPVMNGYDATKQIRMLDRKDAKTIPIIAMTANAFSTDINAAREAGMNAHIAKPFNMKNVLKTIAKHIQVG